MMPGATIRPSASITRAPFVDSVRCPTSTMVPSFTPTSARRRARPVPSMTTPPVITRSYANVPSPSTGPDDALHLGVGVEAEVATIAADATELEAAERRFEIALGGVDADVAAPQLLRESQRP